MESAKNQNLGPTSGSLISTYDNFFLSNMRLSQCQCFEIGDKLLMPEMIYDM